MLGMEPFPVLAQGKEDYLISLAIMTRALKITSERKTEEIEILAELIGYEVAKTVSKMFG